MMASNVFTTPPPFDQYQQLKTGQLDQNLLEKFFTDGFLMIPNLFSIERDLEPCKKAIEQMVDGVAQKLYKAGKIGKLHENSDIFHRLTLLNEEFPGATVLVHKLGIMPDAILKLWTNQKLLNVVEQILGPNIAGHPNWVVRPKIPFEENHDVPWHQDAAYEDKTAENILKITAWIPMTDTNERNGCLEVIKGGHKSGKVAPHLGCWGDTWYLYMDPDKVEESLGVSPERNREAVPVPYGGVLLFSNVLPHRSLPNQSDVIRWSVDLRFQKPLQSYGFHGKKDGLVFRSTEKQNFDQEEWKRFNSVGRNDTGREDEYLLPTVAPFYLYRWPVVHENKHTARLAQLSS